MVLSVRYTDYLSELSGEVELVVEDHDQKWQSSWYPALGDELALAIGYRNEGLLPCGRLSGRSTGVSQVRRIPSLYDALPHLSHPPCAHATVSATRARLSWE